MSINQFYDPRKVHTVSYKHYMVSFDEHFRTVKLSEETSGGHILSLLGGLYDKDGERLDFSEFSSCEVKTTLERTYHEMVIVFSSHKTEKVRPEIVFRVDANGVTLIARELDGYEFTLSGTFFFGDSESYAVNTKNTSSDTLFAAYGHTTSRYDNAIYDRRTDSALEITGCKKLRLVYDHRSERYKYIVRTESEGVAERIRFSLKKNILTDKYSIDYVPLKQHRKFSSPPAGFMTWYSLKFNSSESRVLENASFMSEKLKKYGANTVWVDWEWCHKQYEDERFDGVDNFNPDKTKYPHGLGYLNKEIRALGLTPALWIGFTNDISFTDYEKEHPEISLSHHNTWSGKYYYDFTSPEYINGYLERAIGQVKDWGYDVIKYDTLPNAITAHEKYHSFMKDPSVTTYTAFRNMIKKTRELFGEDCYMLSCGSAEEVILWGTGVFDAARIGPDLFTWEMYVETLRRIRRYYPLHTNTVLCDPDCVVLRDEYSSLAQAKSRMIPVSLLGLPLNLGDELTALPEERLELIKHALPTLNIHPTSFSEPSANEESQLIALKIGMPYESYTVAAFINLTGDVVQRDVDLADGLRLEDGRYLAYDFFTDEYLGIFDKSIYLEAEPYDVRLICLRQHNGVPALLSTSRHFTQGAVEVSDVDWDGELLTLKIGAELISSDPYTLTVYCPEGYALTDCTLGDASVCGRIIKVKYTPDIDGKYGFCLSFSKT